MIKKLWIRKKKKPQKRCYRKGRRKNRNYVYEEKLLEAGDGDELWEDEHQNRHNKQCISKRR